MAFSVLQKTIHNACGTHIGKVEVEEVAALDKHGNEQHFHNWRSVSCPYFMDSTMSHSARVAMFFEEISVFSLFNLITSYVMSVIDWLNQVRANKRFLSEEDRSDREMGPKRRRINAEKRAQ